ncbi:MAG: 50S ribosomal protein L15 [Thermodesulfovibrionia bacterium]|nr:50S ribosomal protein L15 [Thermodesulfovibrionia bacterium]
MRLSDLAPVPGSTKKRKRVGRGPGSGHGKTSCRGHKGQKARTGGGTRPGFEGGQMPLQRRTPKRGFTNIFQEQFSVVNVGALNDITETPITPEVLVEKGLIKNIANPVKILGSGELTNSINVKAHAFSASAKEKIAKAKGNAETI